MDGEKKMKIYVNWTSENSSIRIESEEDMSTLMEDKKSYEAESMDVMEQNVELMNNTKKKVNEVFQTDIKVASIEYFDVETYIQRKK